MASRFEQVIEEIEDYILKQDELEQINQKKEKNDKLLII